MPDTGIIQIAAYVINRNQRLKSKIPRGAKYWQKNNACETKQSPFWGEILSR